MWHNDAAKARREPATAAHMQLAGRRLQLLQCTAGSMAAIFFRIVGCAIIADSTT